MTRTAMIKIGFLGPPGTFTEEALLSQPDLAHAELVPMPTVPDVLAAAQAGEVDLGFVPIENSIEGTVSATLDPLVFEHDLLIQREVVLAVHMQLLALPGTGVDDVHTVVSFPHASAQCRGFLSRRLPRAGVAALGTALAAQLYGLEVIASAVEDHPDNETRFVAVAREGIPPPSGHDRTTIACFQHADRPGNLHAILGQFSARNINLTKLESRPTKKALGQYCFIIDLEGHVDDEVVADCLRDLYAQLEDVKFMGSYPAAGEHGPAIRRDAEAAWRAADTWVESLRRQVRR